MLEEEIDSYHLPIHKHHKLEVDIAMSFPVGAGGNWLLGQLHTGYNIANHHTNDYEANDVIWCTMDAGTIFVPHGKDYQLNINRHNLQILTEHMIREMPVLSMRRYAVSHLPPVLTSKIFDFTADEYLDIRCSDQELVLLRLLDLHKNLMSIDYEHKPWLSALILDEAGFVGPINVNVYLSVMRSIAERLPQLQILFTPMSWRYYIWCTQGHLDTHQMQDMDNFKSFVTSWVRCDLYWNNTYVDDAAAIVGRYCKTIHRLDYRDLFYKSMIPKDSRLNQIDRNQLVAYSRINLFNLRQLSRVLTEDIYADVQYLLHDLAAELPSSQ